MAGVGKSGKLGKLCKLGVWAATEKLNFKARNRVIQLSENPMPTRSQEDAKDMQRNIFETALLQTPYQFAQPRNVEEYFTLVWLLLRALAPLFPRESRVRIPALSEEEIAKWPEALRPYLRQALR